MDGSCSAIGTFRAVESSGAFRGEAGLKSRLVVVAGRPGSGKSTLAVGLVSSLGWPLVSRDEVDAGMNHVLGSSMDKATLAERSFTAFADLLKLLAAQRVAFIAEAAFQNPRWQRALGPVLSEVEVRLVQCVVDPRVAEDRVRRRRKMGVTADAPGVADFAPLSLSAPSLTVSTVDGYEPPLADIVAFARS